ncbi:MAG: hypothetical protein HUU08_15710 [Candidatus Brocadia sp.]|nr:hypothetical protein [Candidatus Brocadia sp.]
MEDIRGDFLGFFDRGVNQAGGGNGTDLSGDTCRELVDQVFGIGVKDFFSVSSSWDWKEEMTPLRPMRWASFWTNAMKGQGRSERSWW